MERGKNNDPRSKKKREKEARLKLKDKAKIVGCIRGIGEKSAGGKG